MISTTNFNGIKRDRQLFLNSLNLNNLLPIPLASQYLGQTKEEQEILNTEFSNKGDLLLKAPTGSGKTTTIIKWCLANASYNKRIAFLCPTQVLVNDLGKEDFVVKNKIKSGYGKTFLNETKNENFIITTYDSIKQRTDFDVVFIDEGHVIAGHADFREVTQDLLLYGYDEDGNSIKPVKKIYVTGTPEVVRNMPNVKLLRFYREGIKKVKVNAYKMQMNDAKREAEAILSTADLDNKLIILRINNKTTIKDLGEWCETKGINCRMLFSEDKGMTIGNKDDLNDIKRGIVPKDVQVLLTTSIIDAGVSLKVKRDVVCYAIGNNRKEQANAIDIIQLKARVRSNTGYTMELNLVGGFGDLPLKRIVAYDNDIRHAANIYNRLEVMDKAYKKYSQLDVEGYSKILSDYDLQLNVVDGYAHKVKRPKNSKRIGEGTIITNLQNFEAIDMLKQAFEVVYQDSSYIEYFTGEQTITNITERKAEDLIGDVVSSVVRFIHPAMYLGKRYDKVTMNKFIDVKDAYNGSNNFKQSFSLVLEAYRSGIETKIATETIMGKLIPQHKELMIFIIGKMFNKVRRFDRPNIKLQKLDKVVTGLDYFIDKIGTAPVNLQKCGK